MADESLVNELRRTLETLTAYRGAELIRRPSEWGTIDFESAERDINLVLDIGQDLSDLPLEYLSDNAAQQINGAIPQVTNYLQSIVQFTLEGDPTGNRNRLSQEFHNVAENLHAISSPFIPYLAYRRGDIAENIAKLNKAVEDSETALEQSESWITERKAK